MVEKRIKKQERRIRYKNQITREVRICRLAGIKPIGMLEGNPPDSALVLCPKAQVWKSRENGDRTAD